MVNILKSAINDMVYISGKQHPFTVEVVCQENTDLFTYIRESSQRSQDAVIREYPVGDFFRSQTKIRDSADVNAKEHVEKFLKLRRVLEDSFSDLRVYSIGLIHMDVYVVGTLHYNYFILRTEIVENKYQSLGSSLQYQRLFPQN